MHAAYSAYRFVGPVAIYAEVKKDMPCSVN